MKARKEVSGMDRLHPEDRCSRCGGKNPSWHAPNGLWNAVTGHPAGLVICPMCFQEESEKNGKSIHFTARQE